MVEQGQALQTCGQEKVILLYFGWEREGLKMRKGRKAELEASRDGAEQEIAEPTRPSVLYVQ